MTVAARVTADRKPFVDHYMTAGVFAQERGGPSKSPRESCGIGMSGL